MSHHKKFAFLFLPHSNKQNGNRFFHFPPNSKKKKRGMNEGSLFYFSVPNMHVLRGIVGHETCILVDYGLTLFFFFLHLNVNLRYLQVYM